MKLESQLARDYKYTNKTSENYFTVIIDQTQSLKEFSGRININIKLIKKFNCWYRIDNPDFIYFNKDDKNLLMSIT